MARLKVGINGFGRIGRVVFRALHKRRDEFQVVGINNYPFDLQSLAYLLRYDSAYGRFAGEAGVDEKGFVVDGEKIPVFGEKEPNRIPWKDLGAEIVLESTGVFRSREQCALHLEAGAKRVLLSAPAKGEIDATVVLGVNDGLLTAAHKVISNASCTTNCLATVCRILHDAFGIKQGFMTTIHAMTNDQSLLDFIHPKEPRRGRAAPFNIVPTSTGAKSAINAVMPEIEGRIDGSAIRVPVITGSMVDLAVTFERPPGSKKALNDAVRAAAEGKLKGIVKYTEDPIVSGDIVGDPHSSIFDATLTASLGENFWKVFAWYDNEWGYSNRCCDLMQRLAALGE